MSTKNQLTFSVSRNDLLYDFASDFSEVFCFKVDDKDKIRSETGVRLQEPLGFDFQGETFPALQIAPLAHLISETLDLDSKDFAVYITLEDIALGIRKNIFEKDIDDITDIFEHKIDLKIHQDLGFLRGFVVRAFLARKNSIEPDLNIIWSKSNIVFQSEFVVKAAVNDALFEINWLIFQDPEIRKNVLIYVDWKSGDVTHSPHTDCFQIVANNDLRAQFKRLENNSHFGHFTIRLLADRIIAELSENALRFADLESEPLEGSLHEKILSLFEDLEMNFTELSQQYKSGDAIDKLTTITEVNRAIQKSHNIAANLQVLKFGGYR
jgi:hypothetical protein